MDAIALLQNPTDERFEELYLYNYDPTTHVAQAYSFISCDDEVFTTYRVTDSAINIGLLNYDVILVNT